MKSDKIFESLEDSIKQIFPKCTVTREYHNCHIDESDPHASVKQILFDIPECLQISNGFVKSLVPFFDKNGSDHIFKKECDGIVFLEHNNKKCCLLIELKSTFDTADINTARKQIASTYIKLNLSLGLLADYNKDDFEFIGIIVSEEPNDNCLQWIQRIALLSDTDSEKKKHLFSIHLFLDKQRIIPYDKYIADKGFKISNHCMYKKMKYCYVGVPSGVSFYKMDITTFL